MSKAQPRKKRDIIPYEDLFDCFNWLIDARSLLKSSKKQEETPESHRADTTIKLCQHVSFAESDIYHLSLNRMELKMRISKLHLRLRLLENSRISAHDQLLKCQALVGKLESRVETLEESLNVKRYGY